MLPVVVVCWRYDFRCFTFSRRYLRSNPMVPPTSQAITPWQEPPSVEGNWGYLPFCRGDDSLATEIIIRHQGFLVQCYLLALYLLTRIIKYALKCLLTIAKNGCSWTSQSNISFQHNSTHLTFIKSFRGSVKTKGCTSFLKTLEFQLHDSVHLHPVSSSFAFWYGIVGRVLMITILFLYI